VCLVRTYQGIKKKKEANCLRDLKRRRFFLTKKKRSVFWQEIKIKYFPFEDVDVE
jgi:hypothetical protein